MNFQKYLDEQQHDEGKPYDVLEGLNIHFEGLLILDIGNRDYNRQQYFNRYIREGTEKIECQKIIDKEDFWNISCKANSKKEAIELIKKYVEIILKKERITSIKIVININLSYLNHKDISNNFFDDPVDYNLFQFYPEKFNDMLPKLIEPIGNYFIEWNGKSWSDRI